MCSRGLGAGKNTNPNLVITGKNPPPFVSRGRTCRDGGGHQQKAENAWLGNQVEPHRGSKRAKESFLTGRAADQAGGNKTFKKLVKRG